MSKFIPAPQKFRDDFCRLANRIVLRRCPKETWLDSLCRIMSMTDVEEVLPENELLMWSHYAGNAKGVRFLFDIPEADDKYWLEHVTYDSRIPCFHRLFADACQDGERWQNVDAHWLKPFTKDVLSHYGLEKRCR